MCPFRLLMIVLVAILAVVFGIFWDDIWTKKKHWIDERTAHSRAIRALYYCFLSFVVFGHVEFFTGGALCRYAKVAVANMAAANGSNATEILMEPMLASM